MSRPKYKSANERISLMGEIVNEEVVAEKEQKYTKWDYVKFLTSKKKELTRDELRWYEPYAINQLFANVNHLLPIIRMCNSSEFMSDKMMHFQFLYNALPNKYIEIGSAQFTKDINPKEHREMVSLLSEKLEIGSNDIRASIRFLGYDAVNKFASGFKITRN